LAHLEPAPGLASFTTDTLDPVQADSAAATVWGHVLRAVRLVPNATIRRPDVRDDTGARAIS
jgi:hypothetical protein